MAPFLERQFQMTRGAGHWPFLDQHDAFVEAMAGVLDRLPE